MMQNSQLHGMAAGITDNSQQAESDEREMSYPPYGLGLGCQVIHRDAKGEDVRTAASA